jgi:beta-aspartyl-peptidase (threonine type)
MRSNKPGRIIISIVLMTAATLHAQPSAVGGLATPRRYGLVIHGGAGNISTSSMVGGDESLHRNKLKEALDAGYAVLDRGGSATDAVLVSIQIMEESAMFDAGRGSYLNAEGVCELDAAVMDGRTLGAGAVAGLQHVKSPIALARDVMERSPHVMLIGSGAEEFEKSLGRELVPNEYFQSAERKLQWQKAHSAGAGSSSEKPHGTVGCAALDRNGNLAAGTSTGGTNLKRFGRVGDSPIIGAGTYANNATCAVSATGLQRTTSPRRSSIGESRSGKPLPTRLRKSRRQAVTADS